MITPALRANQSTPLTFTQVDGNFTALANAINAIYGNVITDTTTARTLALTDGGCYIRMNNAAANTITVPLNAAVAFAIGTQIGIFQLGAGATSVVAASGVTINAKGLDLASQYSSATLKKVGTNEWDLIGEVTTLVPPISCFYPLNATLSQLQGVNPSITQVLALSNSNQTGTYTIQSGSGSYLAAAATDLVTPQLIDTSVHPTAVEWALNLPSLPTAAISGNIELVTTDLAHSVTVSFAARNNTGTPVWDIGLYVDGGNRYSATNLSVAPTMAAVRIVPGSPASVEFYLNGSGTAVSLSSTTVTAAANYIVFETISQSGVAGGSDTGKTAAVTLHSDKTTIVTPMPAGTYDDCGNLIP